MLLVGSGVERKDRGSTDEEGGERVEEISGHGNGFEERWVGGDE